MNLEGIIAISGKSGLYKLVSQGKSTLIVESLSEGKRMPLYASHQVSALEEIGVYTYDDTVALSEVFDAISKKEEGKETISHKSSKDELYTWLREVLPEFDEDRVYPSDIKKIVQWYNLLHDKGMVAVEAEKTA
jgi:hypothetical protein